MRCRSKNLLDVLLHLVLKVPYYEKHVFSGLYICKLVLPEPTNSQNEDSRWVNSLIPLTCHVGAGFDPPTKEHWLCTFGYCHYGVRSSHRLLCRETYLHRTTDRLAEPLCTLSWLAPHTDLWWRSRGKYYMTLTLNKYDILRIVSPGISEKVKG